MQVAEQPKKARTWLTSNEVAEELELAQPTIIKYLQTEKLRGRQLVKGGQWRIEREDLDRFMRGDQNQ